MSTRNPAQNLTFSQLAAQQLNQARNQYAQGQAAQLNQARNQYAPPGQGVFWSQGQAAQKTEWMIAGEPKTFTEFVNIIWPEDSAEKTFFLLKYKK